MEHNFTHYVVTSIEAGRDLAWAVSLPYGGFVDVETEPIERVMIVSSNMRDYDEGLYLMTEDGVPLQGLAQIPSVETFVSTSADGRPLGVGMFGLGMMQLGAVGENLWWAIVDVARRAIGG